MKNQLINYLFNQKILHPTTECQSFYICGKYLNRRITVAAMMDLCGPSIEESQLDYSIRDSLESNLSGETMISQIDTVVIVTGGRLERGHKTSITRFLNWFDYRNNLSKFVFIHNEKSDKAEEIKRKDLKYVMNEVGVGDSILSQVRSLSVATLKPDRSYREVSQELETFRATVLNRPKDPHISDNVSTSTAME